MSWLQYLRIDKFLLVLILVVIIAAFFPCKGDWQVFFRDLTTAAIALLFFINGVKLSCAAVIIGISHWRIHLLVFLSTFVLFPLLGLAMQLLVPNLMMPIIYLGFLYLCALPATLQSSITFTSAAHGNIAAAICSASVSSILGVFLSPLLVRVLIHTHSTDINVLQVISEIMLQLIAPFIVGHLMRPLIEKWVNYHCKLINITDRLSIFLVVYTTFSAAVEARLWNQIDSCSLLIIVMMSLLLIVVVVVINTYAARWLGCDTADEITIVFCGSKKSLVNGIPMANVLFPTAIAGIMVLPLMIFHLVQLMVCALLSQYYVTKMTKQHTKLDAKK